MKNKTQSYLWLICLVFLFTSITWAAKPVLGEIQPNTYPMVAINNHLPALYKNTKDYLNSFQKVELEVGNLRQFIDIPKLGLKNPYTGTIELGDKLRQRFGVIVDIIGEEKRLYVDTNGDGSFANEPWVPLINEWLPFIDEKLGNQNYWVIAPEPITLKVGYKSKPDQSFPIDISVNGILIDPGTTQKEKPYIMIEVRTWFLAKVIEDGSEKMMAIVDHNNNGRFNDPEDQLLIDYNNDSLFSLDEVLVHKKGITVKNGKHNLMINWDVYPDMLKIGRKDQ